MYADEIKVKEGWYVPHFPPRSDRPIEMALVKEWKDFMSYEDHRSCGWTTYLASEILAQIPGGGNERTARVAVTFALWCVTPVGRSFFEPILRRIRSEKAGSFSLNTPKNIAISSWAVENQLGLRSKNILELLLSDANGRLLYKHKPYPTLSDNRAVEETLKFLVNESGIGLLRRVCHASKEANWLPL